MQDMEISIIKSVTETLVWSHSNESYSAVLSCAQFRQGKCFGWNLTELHKNVIHT